MSLAVSGSKLGPMGRLPSPVQASLGPQRAQHRTGDPGRPREPGSAAAPCPLPSAGGALHDFWVLVLKVINGTKILQRIVERLEM